MVSTWGLHETTAPSLQRACRRLRRLGVPMLPRHVTYNWGETIDLLGIARGRPEPINATQPTS